MITWLLLTLGGAVIGTFATILQAIFSFTFPNFFDALVSEWVRGASMLNIFLPMVSNPSATALYHYVGILDLISWFIGVLIFIKGVELILWLLQVIPFFNPPKTLPGKENTLDLGDPTGRVINLKRNKGRGKIRRNTKDVK